MAPVKHTDPSPKVIPVPPPMSASPCTYKPGLLGSDSAINVSVSDVMLESPLALRRAPPEEWELGQPFPASSVLPQGQAIPLPSPRQNDGGVSKLKLNSSHPTPP